MIIYAVLSVDAICGYANQMSEGNSHKACPVTFFFVVVVGLHTRAVNVRK